MFFSRVKKDKLILIKTDVASHTIILITSSWSTSGWALGIMTLLMYQSIPILVSAWIQIRRIQNANYHLPLRRDGHHRTRTVLFACSIIYQIVNLFESRPRLNTQVHWSDTLDLCANLRIARVCLSNYNLELFYNLHEFCPEVIVAQFQWTFFFEI